MPPKRSSRPSRAKARAPPPDVVTAPQNSTNDLAQAIKAAIQPLVERMDRFESRAVTPEAGTSLDGLPSISMTSASSNNLSVTSVSTVTPVPLGSGGGGGGAANGNVKFWAYVPRSVVDNIPPQCNLKGAGENRSTPPVQLCRPTLAHPSVRLPKERRRGAPTGSPSK